MRSRRVAVVITIFAALALQGWSSSASAQAALPLRARVLVTGCGDAADERTLVEQTRVELLSAGVLQVDSGTPAVLTAADAIDDLATVRVAITSCEGVHRSLELSIANRQTGKHVARNLAITDLPETGQGRVVALALLELLRAEWRTLSADSETKAPEPPSPALVAAKRSASPRPAPAEEAPSNRASIEWLGMSRIYPQTDSGDLATSLGLSKVFGAHTRMTFGGTAAGGGGDGSNVHIFQGCGRTALALAGRRRGVDLEVGPVVEAGWGQLRGVQARESGFVAVGALQAAIRVQAAKGIEALVVMHAGYVLAPLTARVMLDDDRLRRTGLEGSVLGVGLGLAGLL